MREAIGGTWLFQIVIVFVLLFTGFMCLSINRSKAFSVKDQIVQTIQSYNGMDLDIDAENNAPLSEIVSYIREHSYRTTGVRPTDEDYTCYTRDGRQLSSTQSNQAVFCVAKIDVRNNACIEGMSCYNELPDMSYYKVVVFYQLDIPIFHDLFNFKVIGDTKTMYGGPL